MGKLVTEKSQNFFAGDITVKYEVSEVKSKVESRVMDQLDKKIIEKMEINGFHKSAALAQSLGVSERTMRRRISMMVSNKLIKVIAVPNPLLCGFKAWAKIGIKVNPEYLRQVAQILVEHPSIYFVAYALGSFNVIIAVHFRDIDELTHFTSSELTGIKGILNAEPWLLSYPRKYYHFSWSAPAFWNKQDACTPCSEAHVAQTDYQTDDINLQILDILRKDGLARPGNIKARLGIGESTIRKRMKEMFANEVYKIEVVPNPEILAYESWATIGLNINYVDAHEVIDSILKYEAVYLASVSLGRFHLVIAARFHNGDSMNRFVTTEIPSISGVSSIQTLVHNRPLKYHNITWPL